MYFRSALLSIVLLIRFSHQNLNLPTTPDLELGSDRDLKNMLLVNYDKERVPQARFGVPVNVSLYMWPYDIMYIKEAQGSIKISGWLDMYWVDHYLKWDPREYGGIEHIFLNADHIWKPGIDIFYTKEDHTSKGDGCGSQCYVRVRHDGHILRGIYFSYAFPCSFNVKYFPFDRQQCELEVANWYLDQSIMDIWPKEKEVDMSVFLPNEEWDLENISVTRKSVFYNYGNFSSIVYKINVSRKPFYYVCNLISPSVIITGAAVIGYHMPSTGAGIHQEKVKMGLTAILSIFILQLGIADKMPRTSDVIPLINIFYFCLVFILSLAILITSLIILVEKQGLKGRRIPNHWRRIFGVKIPPDFSKPVPSTPSSNGGGNMDMNKVKRYSYSSLHTTVTTEEDVTSHRDMPTTDTMNSLSDQLMDNVYFQRKRVGSEEDKSLPSKTSFRRHERQESKSPPPPSADLDYSSEMKRTIIEIRSYIRRKKDRERLRYEWSLLADKLERLSMAGFLFAMVLSCVLFAFHDWY